MNRDIRFPTMWYVRPAKTQISLRIAQSDQSLCWSLAYFVIVKLLTEHHLEFLSFKGGCTGSYESTTLFELTCRGSKGIGINGTSDVILTSNNAGKYNHHCQIDSKRTDK